jgi:hypothetical protein
VKKSRKKSDRTLPKRQARAKALQRITSGSRTASKKK